MHAEEKKAIELIKQHLLMDTSAVPCYQEILQRGYYGFMHFYLQDSKNDALMSTTANYNATIKLAQIEKQRDNKKFSFINGLFKLFLRFLIPS